MTDADVSEDVVPDWLNAYLARQQWELGGQLYRMIVTREEMKDNLGSTVCDLLGTLDSIQSWLDNNRGVLVQAALQHQIEPCDVARWNRGPLPELKQYDTDWVRGQLLGLQKDTFDADSNDMWEAFRDARLTAEQAEHYEESSREIMELLALSYVWSCQASKASHLTERTRRAIENGWFIQAKRPASPQKEEEKSSTTKAVPPAQRESVA